MPRANLTTASSTTTLPFQATTGSIAGSATANVVVTLSPAQAAATYTVQATVEDSAGDLDVVCVISRTTSSVTVKVRNNSVATARTGTLHVLVRP